MVIGIMKWIVHLTVVTATSDFAYMYVPICDNYKKYTLKHYGTRKSTDLLNNQDDSCSNSFSEKQCYVFRHMCFVKLLMFILYCNKLSELK